MELEVFAPIIAAIGLLIWLANRRRSLQGSPEERLMRQYRKQMQNYTPVKLPPDASPEERFINALKDLAIRLNQREIFVQEAVNLWRISEEGSRPLLVLVMGEFKTGKSTFINALLRDEVLIADVAPATAVTTMLKYGSTPSVELHYNDGHVEPWPYKKLGEITAEGDESKRQLRESLDYVELSYPNEILKQINLVDTPGLNVHRESHIRNTENFQHKADVVLWVFNAARSVTQTELREIKALGERLKPFAIVNRIDNIDEEEETVEEVLGSVKRRLGSYVHGIYGLSALQAQEALRADDKAQLQESGWTNFLEQLEKHFLSCSEELKLKALHDKVKNFSESFHLRLEEIKRTVDANEKSFGDKDKAEEELRSSISTLNDLHELMGEVERRKKSAGKSLEGLVAKSEDIKFLDDFSFLNTISNDLMNVIAPLLRVKDFFNAILPEATDKEQMEITAFIDDIDLMDGEIDQQVEAFRYWWQARRHLDTDLANLNTEQEQVNVLRRDYENSGLFGGEPIFDFSGRRARLNSAVEKYNRHLERIQQRGKELWWKFISTCKDTYAKDGEVEKLAKKMDKYFLREKAETEVHLKNVQQDFQREQERQAELKNDLKLGEGLLQELRQEVIA